MDKPIKINFAELEKLVWHTALETFQQAMVEILSLLDNYLMAKRDKSRYEYKERKKRTLITMLGSITIKRRYYWDRDEKKWVFLLDDVLSLNKVAVSDALKELVVIWATKGPSYRDVRDRLEDLFGNQVLSHETIRQLLIKSSDILKKTFEPEEQKKQVKILFIEADGFWTGVQKRGCKKSKKRETKLVVVHEGWEKRQAQDYRLKSPMYITSDTLEEGEELWDRVYLRIMGRYQDVGSIPIIINGDFASWIRGGVDSFKKALYQYDRFHLKREISKVLPKSADYCQQALLCVSNNDSEGVLRVLDQAFVQTQDKNIFALKVRLQNHQETLIDYRKRLSEKGFEISGAWRGMGAAESNVDRFKLRVSKRGRAWSKKGLGAILNMLGMLYEDVLKDALAGLDSSLFTKPQTEEIVELSAGQIAKKVGVGVLNIRKGSIPSIHKGASQGYSKLLRQMLNVQSV